MPNRPPHEPRRWKFSCCCQVWLDTQPTSHCGRCATYVDSFGQFNEEDDDPRDFGEEPAQCINCEAPAVSMCYLCNEPLCEECSDYGGGRCPGCEYSDEPESEASDG